MSNHAAGVLPSCPAPNSLVPVRLAPPTSFTSLPANPPHHPNCRWEDIAEAAAEEERREEEGGLPQEEEPDIFELEGEGWHRPAACMVGA